MLFIVRSDSQQLLSTPGHSLNMEGQVQADTIAESEAYTGTVDSTGNNAQVMMNEAFGPRPRRPLECGSLQESGMGRLALRNNLLLIHLQSWVDSAVQGHRG